MKRRTFWNYNKSNPKLKIKIRYMHNNVMNMQKSIITVTIFVILLLYLRPVLNRTERFIFYCFVPYNSVVWETLLLFAQYYLITMVVPVVFGCDFVYLGMSIHVISQLKLLNWELEHIKLGDGKRRMENCIRHHQLMLS